MSVTPLTFTGVSEFSDDFQTILNRSVSIASVPLTLMQNRQADLLSKKQLLTGMRTAVAGLASSVSALGNLGDTKAVTATSSDSNSVAVSVTGTVQPGTYEITDITSVAKAASGTTVSGYATADSTPVSEDGLLELVVGNTRYTIDLSAEGSNNLNGLRDAINALGAGVNATVLNTGTGETPYYLSLSASSTGLRAFELRETAGVAASNILTNTLPEADAVFTSDSGYESADATEVSSDGLLQLVVGASKYAIDISSDNNLDGLCEAINALEAGVSAEVVEDGSEYYLSITSAAGEQVELQETADEEATNLLTNAHQGANAVFKLDGLDIVKADNVINDVIPGLTFTIVEAGGEATLTLTSSRAELANALEDLVSSYNAVRELVNAQIGENAGLLSGDPVVREVQSQMRQLTVYRTSSGAIQSLTDLGIELDDTGVMSFNSSLFYSLSNADLSDAFTFLGSTTSGFGALSSNLTAISDPVTGMIVTQQDQIDVADERLTLEMEELAERIELMQTSLTAKLQAADALLAQLEAQQTILEASIKGLNLLLYGKKED